MNTDLLRSFVLISELGSLSKAAERMRVSQSTLTRQMQVLEHEIGGRLFERGHAGVALTAAGQRLLLGMPPLLDQLNELLTEVGKLARGKTSTIRVGYLGSMAASHLSPALRVFRQQHPAVKVTLRDLSPGEQLAALRAGQLDVAFIGEVDRSLGREFYLRSVGTLPLEVVLSEEHPLARKAPLRLVDLRDETFVRVPDSDIPGYERWLTQLCRKAGFRPRFGEVGESIGHALALVVSDNLVTTVPKYDLRPGAPGVVFRELPLVDAKWEMLVSWQRGKVAAPLCDLVDALAQVVSRSRPPAPPRS
ncbi:LysR family transcriptional regulator [Opitutus sp. ER46]|uniref:LysR substrate-binding domain-containing protein n=1 Tax=Opitutus sp. ER46 TaxID=2161864 RepID=UPI000D2F8772|nr:LysR family transcriptional regulator [Opitutus sp. ER46]PTX97995.1 LysR family transcriptional regulator [Opitutus sp. ER46]